MTKQIDIDYLAKLAMLEISSEEKEKLTEQLGKTVDYIEVLNELDTNKIEPTFQVTGQVNVSRKKDETEKSLSHDGYFVVEKIKWNEDDL